MIPVTSPEPFIVSSRFLKKDRFSEIWTPPEAFFYMTELWSRNTSLTLKTDQIFSTDRSTVIFKRPDQYYLVWDNAIMQSLVQLIELFQYVETPLIGPIETYQTNALLNAFLIQAAEVALAIGDIDLAVGIGDGFPRSGLGGIGTAHPGPIANPDRQVERYILLCMMARSIMAHEACHALYEIAPYKFAHVERLLGIVKNEMPKWRESYIEQEVSRQRSLQRDMGFNDIHPSVFRLTEDAIQTEVQRPESHVEYVCDVFSSMQVANLALSYSTAFSEMLYLSRVAEALVGLFFQIRHRVGALIIFPSEQPVTFAYHQVSRRRIKDQAFFIYFMERYLENQDRYPGPRMEKDLYIKLATRQMERYGNYFRRIEDKTLEVERRFVKHAPKVRETGRQRGLGLTDSDREKLVLGGLGWLSR